MAGVSPHPSAQDAAAAAHPNVQSYNQTAEFFLSNYRLGKTLGIGSFGKVCTNKIHIFFAGVRHAVHHCTI
jgi:5'-AMP-activated protein kinase catalytic alpha subunit